MEAMGAGQGRAAKAATGGEQGGGRACGKQSAGAGAGAGAVQVQVQHVLHECATVQKVCACHVRCT